METIRNIAETCMQQLGNYPTVSKNEKAKRMIKQYLLGQKTAPADPYSWPNAMLAEGLLETFEVLGEKKYLDAVVKYLEQWIKAGLQIHYVDNLMNGHLALWIEALVEEKAAILYSESEKQQILAVCEKITESCAAWVRNAAKSADGILVYRQQHASWIFADTVGMVCPFLCRYGTVKKDEEMLNLGILQMQTFLQKALDKRSGLPYHGYDESSGVKLGIIGWGRACGWVMKGMADSMLWIPGKRREKRQLKIAFWKLKDSAAKYQRRDGGFSWQVQAQEGPVDVSAGAMIGNAIRKTSQKSEPREDITELLNQLQESLLISVNAGIVTNCSGECHGFAEYPQVYGSYPWGTGSVLQFLAGQHR